MSINNVKLLRAMRALAHKYPNMSLDDIEGLQQKEQTLPKCTVCGRICYTVYEVGDGKPYCLSCSHFESD